METTERPTDKNSLKSPRNIIPKSQLKHGVYYRGRCRNATVARWHAGHQMFYHWRTKFANTYIEGIKHREDENYLDVFDAHEEVPTPQEEVPFNLIANR